jgi:sugar phosphate isomerase/epimerase
LRAVIIGLTKTNKIYSPGRILSFNNYKINVLANKSMKLSISTAVYYRYSLIESIKRIAELGYNAVEIWGGRPHAFPDDMTDSKINEIKKCIREYDLEISGLIPAQFRYPTNLSIEDEKIREAC